MVGICELDIHIRFAGFAQSFRHCLPLVWPNVFVETSPKQKLGGVQIGSAVKQSGSHGVRRDAAAIKRRRGLDRQCGIRKEGNSTAHAEADASEWCIC